MYFCRVVGGGQWEGGKGGGIINPPLKGSDTSRPYGSGPGFSFSFSLLGELEGNVAGVPKGVGELSMVKCDVFCIHPSPGGSSK